MNMNDWGAVAIMVLAVASCTAITAVYQPQPDATSTCIRNGCTQADRVECLKVGKEAKP